MHVDVWVREAGWQWVEWMFVGGDGGGEWVRYVSVCVSVVRVCERESEGLYFVWCLLGVLRCV